MKRNFAKLLMIMAVFFSVFTLTAEKANAMETSQDGIRLIMETDKGNYTKGEKITTTIRVTNTNGYDVKDVELNLELPEKFSSENTKFSISSLKSYETKEFKVKIEETNSEIEVTPSNDNESKNDNTANSEKKSDAKTGDDVSNKMLAGLISLLGISGIGFIYLKKKKNIKKIFILVLVSVMTLSGLAMKTVHAENDSTEKTMSLIQSFIYDNNKYEMTLDVTYLLENGQTITSGEVTREEWVTKLLSLFDYNINDREYSFSDSAEAKNPKMIETAIQYSIIDIKDNDAFKPKDYATREFVAYTAIKAIRLSNTSQGSLSCADQAVLMYPDEDYLAVENQMFNLIDNQFKPEQYVSKEETDQVIKIINQILDSAKINSDSNNYVEYQDDVKEIDTSYQTVSDNTIIVYDTAGFNKGDLVVLNGDSTNGLAIQVEEVKKLSENQYQLQYIQPELEDILNSLHIEGRENNSNATFVPEDDVIVENQSRLLSRAKYDSVPLDKELKLSTKIKDFSASMTLNLEELQYRFDIEYGFFKGLQINDAYFALVSDLNANITYEGSENLIERDEPEKIRKKIGDIYMPLQYGFMTTCEVYLVGTIEGKLEINVTLGNTTGFQYKNNNFRTISDTETELAKMEISAAARLGVEPEAGVKWLNFDIANVSASVGIGVEGSVKNQLKEPYQFCIDGKIYLYATAAEELIPDITDELSNEVDIYNLERSPFKLTCHFEETGKVEKCTRNMGSYHGIVKDSQTNAVLPGAQVQIFKDNKLIATKTTDDHGEFTGEKIDSGEYNFTIQAEGYILYQQTVSIIGGQNTNLEIFLEKKVSQDNGATIGDTYRFTNITQDYAFVVLQGNEDTIYNYCDSDDNHQILVNLDKGTTQSLAIDPGKYIDITITKGNISVYARKDGETNFVDISDFYSMNKLNHEAVKIYECNSGQKISIDYKKIGNKNTWVGASIYFQGDVVEEYYNYYWNAVRGDEVIYEKTQLDVEYPNLWPIFEEGERREYTVENGVLYVYFPYESDEYNKLTISIE